MSGLPRNLFFLCADSRSSKAESLKDAMLDLEHRERSFTTKDGFKVGYYQQGKEQNYFLRLNDYQSDATFFFYTFEQIIDMINGAVGKINELTK